MKKLLFLTMVSLALAFMSCTGSNSTGDTQQQDANGAQTESQQAEPQKEGKEYTSAYVCPMHCEGSGSEEPGQCPVCGMDYVALADLDEAEHSH